MGDWIEGGATDFNYYKSLLGIETKQLIPGGLTRAGFQLLQIPIRDWNKQVGALLVKAVLFQLLQIPIRDWNPRSIEQAQREVDFNYYKSLLGIETKRWYW